MVRVFLSYSRRDAAFVGRLADDLEARGVESWLDTDDLPTESDDRWRRSVVRGIRESVAVILVLSPDSVRSVSVERELTIAAEMARRIIPIMHRQCELSDGVLFDLAGLQRTDFAGQPYDNALEELVQRVHAGAAPPAALPPTATKTPGESGAHRPGALEHDHDGDLDRNQNVPLVVESVEHADTDHAANPAVECDAHVAPTEQPKRKIDHSRPRVGRWLVAAAAVLVLVAVGVLALTRIGKPRDEGAAGPVATSPASGRAETTTVPASTTDRRLVPWDAAFATLERQDGTTAIVKASSVGLTCSDTLQFMNGQTVSLDRVESIQFDAIFLDNASADGVVKLLDGRELTDSIYTWNCPISGTTDLGPIQIPLADIKRITFSR